MFISVLTSTHRISGEAAVGDQRLSDLLNNRMESVVRLTDATVVRATTSLTPLERGANVVVHKRSALVVLEQSENAALSPRLHTRVPKRTREVLLLVDGIEVRGRLHTSESLDIAGIQRFMTAPGAFVPVTDALVSIGSDPAHDIQADVVLVNLQQIRLIASSAEEARTVPLPP